ncbi:MAG: putative intracellular septation protein A [Paracidovorax wautersii]|uniref:Inner membrane-spanning protein YciB n=1 Tax=Paracidovorax wautersii TaxID=1177982 RepID=A0A7V8FLR8_9BURK|nr:MAG: putative intracellular septation protein A [Paracidovorax wautersii]
MRAMKALLDFVPILLFFAAYKLVDIYVATGVLMAATCVQMAIVYAIDRKLQTMHKATLVLILIFGALTLALHDDTFIKWKPTVLYTAMALALLGGQWLMRRNFLHLLLGKQLPLPEPIWNRLNYAWALYFLFMAALNAYVAMAFSTAAWMDFKLWGYVFPIAFILAQGLYVSRHLGHATPGGEDGDDQQPPAAR